MLKLPSPFVGVLSPFGRQTGAPPIITATVAPALGALSDGDAIQDAFSANIASAANYASTAGTISSVVVAVTVDAVSADQTDLIEAGNVVVVTVTVTDSAANERVWSLSTTAVAIAPAQFTSNMWSVAVNELTLSSLPDDGGSALTDIEYNVNGGAAVSTGETTTGTYTITAADGTAVRIRAVNSIGAGTQSDAKTVTADAFSIGGASPELVVSYTKAEDGTTDGEYFRAGGVETTSAVVTSTVPGLRTMYNASGNLVWNPHNLMDGSHNFNDAGRWFPQDISVSAGSVTGPDGATALWALTDSNGAAIGGLLDVGNVTFGPRTTLEIWSEKDDDETRFPAVSVSGAGGAIVAWNTKTGATNAISGSPTIEMVEAVTGLWRLRVTVETAATRDVVLHPAYGTTISAASAAATGTTEMGFLAIYRSDLGGMADNPDMPAGLEKYVPTTSAAVYLPRRYAYYYNGSAWVLGGMQVETEARTNLLLNSATLSTQNVTVTAAAHTLSFTGTGTVTLSGVSTAGPLVGTGTGNENRVSLTFTPTAGTLTLTVTGTVTTAQLEVGSTPSSYIPTTGATVTRAAESQLIAAANTPANTTAMSISMKGLMTYADTNGNDFVLAHQYASASNFIIFGYMRTNDGTGKFQFQQTASGTLDFVQTGGSAFSPGVNVPFSLSSRHTSSAVNAASSGTALTADTTPTALPDLSATDVSLGYAIGQGFNGYIEEFRMWGSDIGDTGIAEVTA